MESNFEWDESKNQANLEKHGLSFELAQYAFFDTHRIILEDLAHSVTEKRFYCLGKVNQEIITVRFTYRNGKIRIFGAGYWRKGRKFYEQRNHLHE
ncbi:BrnT family toxin [Cyanothece sp. BG0011]|uniref:BrnT family toxin n=1 Tax=Cyanothece sp. BG0011 TaxID=2082950 RepID=UPI000D1D8854|nr:BrnT family toxin [Cyanothece sp. BG0011]